MSWFSERSGYVYVIRGEHGLVKVGHSVDPPQRLATLQTGSPFTLDIVHSLFIRSDAEAVEASARETLARWCVRGEWFDVTPDVAIAAVYGAAARCGSLDRTYHQKNTNTLPLGVVVAACYMPTWIGISLGGSTLGILLLTFSIIAQSAILLQRNRVRSLKFFRSSVNIIGGIALSAAISALACSFAQRALAHEIVAIPIDDVPHTPQNFVDKDGATFCKSKSQLADYIKAIKANDEALAFSVGCSNLIGNSRIATLDVIELSPTVHVAHVKALNLEHFGEEGYILVFGK